MHPSHLILPDGVALQWRAPSGPDESSLQTLVASMTPQERRWRFHGAVNGLTSEHLQRMVAPAPGTLAWVAAEPVDEQAPAARPQTLVADIRCVVDATGSAAEVALMVAPAWRRRGVGALGLAALGRAARDAGLRWLYGQVLADNLPMLALVRRCGFSTTPNRANHRLVTVEWRTR